MRVGIAITGKKTCISKFFLSLQSGYIVFGRRLYMSVQFHIVCIQFNTKIICENTYISEYCPTAASDFPRSAEVDTCLRYRELRHGLEIAVSLSMVYSFGTVSRRPFAVRPFSRWTLVSRYQNVSILDFIGAKGDGVGAR